MHASYGFSSVSAPSFGVVRGVSESASQHLAAGSSPFLFPRNSDAHANPSTAMFLNKIGLVAPGASGSLATESASASRSMDDVSFHTWAQQVCRELTARSPSESTLKRGMSVHQFHKNNLPTFSFSSMKKACQACASVDVVIRIGTIGDGFVVSMSRVADCGIVARSSPTTALGQKRKRDDLQSPCGNGPATDDARHGKRACLEPARTSWWPASFVPSSAPSRAWKWLTKREPRPRGESQNAESVVVSKVKRLTTALVHAHGHQSERIFDMVMIDSNTSSSTRPKNLVVTRLVPGKAMRLHHLAELCTAHGIVDGLITGDESKLTHVANVGSGTWQAVSQGGGVCFYTVFNVPDGE